MQLNKTFLEKILGLFSNYGTLTIEVAPDKSKAFVIVGGKNIDIPDADLTYGIAIPQKALTNYLSENITDKRIQTCFSIPGQITLNLIDKFWLKQNVKKESHRC